MTITVLGKRSRASDEGIIPSTHTSSYVSPDSPAEAVISCRAKRRATVLIAEDGNKENNDDHDDRTPQPSPVKRVLSIVPSEDDNNENAIPTPDTPRHRDSLSKKCPVTPRHRMLINGRSGTPRTPRTPSTPAGFAKSIFNDAKKVFTRGADGIMLVGREKEKAELESFIEQRMETQQGGCLYVSGPPGTGKSAFVTTTCRGLQTDKSINYAYINCMSVKSASELYDLMAAELNLDDAVCQGFSKTALHRVFGKEGKDVSLVVLDEIDQLLQLDNTTLCNFFELSFAKDSKLILIGIANALDLTDRFLPRLKAKNLKPALLPFLPYNAAEIASVLSSRARSLLPSGDSITPPDFTPLLHPTAIQLISKKVASQSGDLRKAFDIAFRAIELVETETRDKLAMAEEAEAQQAQAQAQAQAGASPSRTPLSETVNLSSPPPSGNSTPRPPPPRTASTAVNPMTITTAPRATLAHVVRVTAAAMGQGANQRLKALNLQQKAVLCSLIALEERQRRALTDSCPGAASSLPSPSTPTARKLFTTPKKSSAGQTAASSTSAAPTLRSLYETYSTLCKRDDVLHALSSSEFRDVVANLETMSLVAAAEAAGGKSGSNSGLFASALTGAGTPGRSGGGRKKNVVVPVDERKVKAMVGARDLESAVEGVGAGVLKGMLCGEVF